MTYKDLKKRQDELDEEILICPKCGDKEKWGWFREWGCNRDLDKEAEKDKILTQ